MNYGLTPFIEHRGDNLIYRYGWNHACYHLTYKDNPAPWYLNEGAEIEPDVFYNRLFAGVGTPTVRRRNRVEQAFANTDQKQLTWYAEGGYYLQELGGIVDDESLYGGNDWEWDLRFDAMYPLWIGESTALFANNSFALLGDGEGDTYSRDLVELELVD